MLETLVGSIFIALITLYAALTFQHEVILILAGSVGAAWVSHIEEFPLPLRFGGWLVSLALAVTAFLTLIFSAL